MDEEQVKALIAAALGEFKSEVTGIVDQKNSGLAASITREIKKLIPEKSTEDPKPELPSTPSGEKGSEGEGKLTLKMVQQELQKTQELAKQLQQERDDEKAATSKARQAEALSSAIAQAKILNPNALRKLLTLEFGESIKQENDAWLVAQGETVKTLDAAIADYLKTDEGKAFLPPSGVNGSGSTESKSTLPATATPQKAIDALSEAFAGF